MPDGKKGYSRIPNHGDAEADVPVETSEEALHRPVVRAGAFDSDEEIAELVPVTSLLELLVDGAQGAVVVGEFRGWNQHLAEEIG